MKTKQDKDMTDLTSAVYTDNETELSWPIGLGAVCSENQIRQRRDQSYKCNLRRNGNRTVMTVQTGCNL